MGLFDAFKSVVKAGVDTVILPVELAKDVVTGDIILEHDRKLGSAKRLKKVKENLQKAYDKIDE